MTLNPHSRELKGFSFNQLLNTLIILKKEIDSRTKVLPKKLVPQTLFIIGEISFNNLINLKEEST